MTGTRRARVLRVMLSLIVSCGAAAWALSVTDLAGVAQALRRLETRWLAAAVLLTWAQAALLGARWSLFAKKLGLDLSLRHAVAEYCLSIVLNQVLPTGFAGDGMRLLRQIAKKPGQARAALEAVALDRASGQLVLFVLALVVLPLAFGGQFLQGARLVGVALALLVTALGLSVGSRISPRIRALAVALRRYARLLLEPKQALTHWLLSCTFLFVSLLQVAVAAWALQLQLNLVQLLTLGAALLLAASVPSFIGSWGVREGASAAVFTALGLDPSVGVSVSVAYGLLALVASLPGLLLVPYLRAERATQGSH
jgi:glycosyltransferase 2 family protein